MSDQFIDHNYQEHKETGQLIPFDMIFLYNRATTFTLSLTNCAILCLQRSLKAQCIKPLNKALAMFLFILVWGLICIKSLFSFQMSTHSSKSAVSQVEISERHKFKYFSPLPYNLVDQFFFYMSVFVLFVHNTKF